VIGKSKKALGNLWLQEMVSMTVVYTTEGGGRRVTFGVKESLHKSKFSSGAILH